MTPVNAQPDLYRLLSNLIRLGTIAEVDHAAARCRVQSGDVLTAPLPWLSARAGTSAVTWDAPSVGEQVVMLSADGDLCAAVVLTGVYSNAVPAPSASETLHTRHYIDGAVIEYDHAAHALHAMLPAGGTAALSAPGGITITGDVQITGNVQIDGNTGITGTATADMDVIAAGISLKTHKHSGVQSGGALSGPPQ